MSNDHPPGFFEATEMPTAGWWEALWLDPAGRARDRSVFGKEVIHRLEFRKA